MHELPAKVGKAARLPTATAEKMFHRLDQVSSCGCLKTGRFGYRSQATLALMSPVHCGVSLVESTIFALVVKLILQKNKVA